MIIEHPTLHEWREVVDDVRFYLDFSDPPRSKLEDCHADLTGVVREMDEYLDRYKAEKQPAMLIEVKGMTWFKGFFWQSVGVVLLIAGFALYLYLRVKGVL